MTPRQIWPDDPTFIELGVRDAELALSLRGEGYSKYLGVSGNGRRIIRLLARHPELDRQLTCSNRRKLVLNNNAQVLVLSGPRALNVWKYKSVRHAEWVAWRMGASFFALAALAACLFHAMAKRFSWPQVVTFRTPGGKTVRLLASRVLRRKVCRRKSLHFIPHGPGLTGLFRQFDQRGVRYAVLRWFESLPEIEPSEDVDLLVGDDSLADVLDIFKSQPGILPCDLYSESGLAQSDYCGTPYYPADVARRILNGTVRHKGLCLVPNAWDYFHSLAYHAVYHKGTRANLHRGGTALKGKVKSDHDYAGILRAMADRLNIDAEISLEGLHAYLQESGWGPSPEMLARLAAACRESQWLEALAKRLQPHLHDQGLAVFVVRREAVRRGFYDQIVSMIEASGFEILATSTLLEHEVEYAAARTRGGNWDEEGPFDLASGPPAAVVVAYDCHPQPLTKRQERRFVHRTNARLFCKEAIRDAIIAQLPPKQSFNALHSSDNVADAWHLLEVLAPQLMEEVRARLRQIRGAAPAPRELQRAA